MASNEGISRSLIMRALVNETLEIKEDIALARIADLKEQTFDPEKALSHDDVWDRIPTGCKKMDLPKIDWYIRIFIRKAIEERIMTASDAYIW